MPSPKAWSVRRLRKVEYANSVRAAFGLEDIGLDRLPEDDPTRSTPSPATALEVGAYHQLAKEISDAASLEVERACRDRGRGCWEQTVRAWGRRLFRRELDRTDMADVGKVCRTGRGQGDAAGLKSAAMLLLQAPEFLYVVEHGSPDHRDNLTHELVDEELAARLALALWLGPPDDELLRAARRGSLATPQGLTRQVDRMLQHRKARAMVAHHLSTWLAPELLAPTTAGEQSGAGTAERERAMLEQLTIFASNLYRKGGGFSAFMTDASSSVPESLAKLYGGNLQDAASFQWLKTDDRHGLLTLPAFLAAKATPSDTSIVRRGLFVSEQLLCRTVPPPPKGVDTTIAPPLPGETTRERFERHASDPACASCHRLMDPLGFAFENYDKSGRYRTEDHSGPLDTAGSIVVDGDRREFGDLSELSSLLANSTQARTCWTRQWVTWMLPAEPPRSVEALAEEVAMNATKTTPLASLLKSIVTSDRFRRVTRPGSGGNDQGANATHVPEDVRRSVGAHCKPCHFPGGEAFEDADLSVDGGVLDHATRIVERVEVGDMPPDQPLDPRDREVFKTLERRRIAEAAAQ